MARGVPIPEFDKHRIAGEPGAVPARPRLYFQGLGFISWNVGAARYDRIPRDPPGPIRRVSTILGHGLFRPVLRLLLAQ